MRGSKKKSLEGGIGPDISVLGVWRTEAYFCKFLLNKLKKFEFSGEGVQPLSHKTLLDPCMGIHVCI